MEIKIKERRQNVCRWDGNCTLNQFKTSYFSVFSLKWATDQKAATWEKCVGNVQRNGEDAEGISSLCLLSSCFFSLFQLHQPRLPGAPWSHRGSYRVIPGQTDAPRVRNDWGRPCAMAALLVAKGINTETSERVPQHGSGTWSGGKTFGKWEEHRVLIKTIQLFWVFVFLLLS